jgi:hypothetical protein
VTWDGARLCSRLEACEIASAWAMARHVSCGPHCDDEHVPQPSTIHNVTWRINLSCKYNEAVALNASGSDHPEALLWRICSVARPAVAR